MAVDLGVFGRQKTLLDHVQLQQAFEAKKQMQQLQAAQVFNNFANTQALAAERDYQHQKDAQDFALRSSAFDLTRQNSALDRAFNERKLKASMGPDLNDMGGGMGLPAPAPGTFPAMPNVPGGLGVQGMDMTVNPALVGAGGSQQPVAMPPQISTTNLVPVGNKPQSFADMSPAPAAPQLDFARDNQGGYVTKTKGGAAPKGYAYLKDGTFGRIPGVEKSYSPTEQKELFETADTITASEGAKGALVAARNLLDDPEETRPYSGFGADTLTTAARIPFSPFGDKTRAAATTDYNTLVKEQALSSLKATFGGNPTEGERQILLSLQALSTYTPQEQKAILNRAIDAADRRAEFNRKKAGAIQGRDYGSLVDAASDSGTKLNQTSGPKMGSVVDGFMYLGGDPGQQSSWKKAR